MDPYLGQEQPFMVLAHSLISLAPPFSLPQAPYVFLLAASPELVRFDPISSMTTKWKSHKLLAKSVCHTDEHDCLLST